jgi:hypothetical protein
MQPLVGGGDMQWLLTAEICPEEEEYEQSIIFFPLILQIHDLRCGLLSHVLLYQLGFNFSIL